MKTSLRGFKFSKPTFPLSSTTFFQIFDGACSRLTSNDENAVDRPRADGKSGSERCGLVKVTP